MIGPLPTAPGGFNHILVAVDKFTKWIDYKPITKISSNRVVDFFCDILDRFGFPNAIITDLGSNFPMRHLWECIHRCQLCVGLSSKGQWSSWANQQINHRWALEKDLWWELKKRRKMDTRTLTCCLGAAYWTKQSNRTDSFLPSVWIRSYPPCGHHVEVTKTRDVW